MSLENNQQYYSVSSDFENDDFPPREESDKDPFFGLDNFGNGPNKKEDDPADPQAELNSMLDDLKKNIKELEEVVPVVDPVEVKASEAEMSEEEKRITAEEIERIAKKNRREKKLGEKALAAKQKKGPAGKKKAKK